jgi:TIR domain
MDAIEQSRITVLVFSADANKSPQVRKEVECAVNRNVVILPLRIENVLPGDALEFFIGNVHWLDALTPPLEEHLQRLAGTVKAMFARRDEISPEPTPHPLRRQWWIYGWLPHWS